MRSYPELQSLLTEVRRARIWLKVVNGRLVLEPMQGPVPNDIARRVRAIEGSVIDFLNAARARKRVASRAGGGAARLTPGQVSMLFMDRLYAGSGLFNLISDLEIAGPLALPALGTAFQFILDRHPILSCPIVETEGEASWSDSPTLERGFGIVDLSGLAEPVRQQAVRAIVASERVRSFGRTSWVRAIVCRLSERRSRMIVSRHHIVSDGWSFAILNRELEMAYRALRRGSTPQLPEIGFGYHDYCRTIAARAADSAGLNHWISLLQDAPRRLSFPNWSAEEREDIAPIDSCEFALGVEGLSAIAGASGIRITPFAALLGLFALLLHHCSAQIDIPIGTDATCRSGEDAERLVGLFVNRLPLRVQIDPAATVRCFLSLVQEVVTTALMHRDVPFSEIARQLRANSPGGLAPLFNIMFGLHNNPHHVLRLDEDLECRPLTSEGSKYSELDLSLYLTTNASGATAELGYRRSLLDRHDAERLCLEYQELVKALPNGIDASVHDFLGLDHAEVADQTLLARWESIQAAVMSGRKE